MIIIFETKIIIIETMIIMIETKMVFNAFVLKFKSL